jgi:putative peptidoglycan lipid II flippase
LVKRDVYHRSEGWLKFSVRILFASIIMVVVVLWMNSETSVWFEMTVWERVMELSILVLVGVSVYFGVLLLSGMNLKRLIKGVSD